MSISMKNVGKCLDSLKASEAEIRDFVETVMMDKAGLVLSHLNVNTLKPWANEECIGHNHPFLYANTNDPASYIAYEDSLMATAEYAHSQLIRFETTGEPEALVAASHPIYALLRVLEEGEKYEKGFLPKPFGGVKTAGYSHELSVDQYIKVVLALREYERMASPALKNVIDDYLVAMADYHLARNFIHPRRDRMMVTPENRCHGLCLFVPILIIAKNITGDSGYLDPLKKGRFDEAYDLLLKLESPQFNIASLVVEGFQLAIEEGLADERLIPVIIHMWRENLPRIDSDGQGFFYPNRPVKTSRVLRVAAFAPIILKHLPDEEAEILEKSMLILSAITDPKKMLYITDGYENDPNFNNHYMAECVCETSVSSWLVAYWRWRKLTIKGLKI